MQEAAYESLLKSRRRELHAQVASALGDAPHEVKARHLATAGDVEAAIAAWRRAGTHALRRSAFREAETHLGEAIRLLGTQPDSPQRAERELALRIPYNRALLVSRGPAAAETVASNVRTRILCEALGDDEEIFNALQSAFTVANGAGETPVALELAERMVELAARADRDAWRCWAYAFRGAAQYTLGAFAEAQADFDQAIHRYVAERFMNDAFDPRAVTFPYAALTAWQRGRRETARRLMSEIAAAAEVSERPFDRGLVRVNQLALAVYDETPDAARQLARELSRLSGEVAFPLLVANGQFFTGYVMAVVDGELEGVRLMRSGLSGLISSGNRSSLSGFMRALGDGQSHVGDRDGALATFDAALTEVGDDRVHRPEIHFARAHCLARHAADAATLETAFRAALDEANAIDALSWALRAASGLARVLAENRPPRRSARRAGADLRSIHRGPGRRRPDRSARPTRVARLSDAAAHMRSWTTRRAAARGDVRLQARADPDVVVTESLCYHAAHGPHRYQATPAECSHHSGTSPSRREHRSNRPGSPSGETSSGRRYVTRPVGSRRQAQTWKRPTCSTWVRR